MEPPALTTCPSRVTIRKRWLYRLAMATAASRSSAMTVRPKTLRMMPAYRLSYPTSSEATPR